MGQTFTGGEKLQKKLQEIAEKLGAARTVRVGFLENATYPDNAHTPVALVAAVNEFGGTVTVPAHEVTVSRKLKANGDFARGGKFVKAKEANFQSTHTVEEYTATIPARPFFRSMIRKNKSTWGPQMLEAVKAANYDARVALGRMGQNVKEQLQESIQEFDSPGNAPSTARAKGFDKPLVDSSHMLNTVDYEVNE